MRHFETVDKFHSCFVKLDFVVHCYTDTHQTGPKPTCWHLEFLFQSLLILWKNSWFCMGLWQWFIHCNNNNNNNKLPGTLWAPGPVMGLIYLLNNNNNNNNNNTLDAAHCEAYVIWAKFRKLAVFPLSRETVSLSQFLRIRSSVDKRLAECNVHWMTVKNQLPKRCECQACLIRWIMYKVIFW